MNKKEIEGFDNYSITPEGLVLNGDRPLKVMFGNHNTPIVRLFKDGEYFTFGVAKLVALTYLGKPENPSDVVGFLDGNNHNYHVDNLYWTSRSEAYSKFYREKNRYSEARLEKLRKKLCKPVMSCKRTLQGLVQLKVYESISDAARDKGVAPASILRCLKDEKASCMGLAWRYINKEE
jgi:hypothetical protein